MELTGKALIAAGVIIVLVGVGFLLASRFPGIFGWIGHLPGDIHIKRESVSFYFPLGTCVLISVIGSFILWLVARFF